MQVPIIINKNWDLYEKVLGRYNNKAASIGLLYNKLLTDYSFTYAREKRIAQKSEDYLETYKPNVKVSEKIKENTFHSSEQVKARVTREINNVLSDAYNEGLGREDVVKKLNEKFTSLKEYETRRIAVTEINSSRNTANYQQIQNDNISYKQWITAEDNRVRPSHVDLHGHITRTDNKFSNGLLYPGDKSGSIKEWITCRCVVLPYFIPWGKEAPDLVEFTEDQLVNADESLDDFFKKFNKPNNNITETLELPVNEEKKLLDFTQGKDTELKINLRKTPKNVNIITKPTKTKLPVEPEKITTETYNLTAEELQKLEELENKKANGIKLKFKEKGTLRKLKEQQEFSKWHERYLTEKLTVEEYNEYVIIRNKVADKLKIEKFEKYVEPVIERTIDPEELKRRQLLEEKIAKYEEAYSKIKYAQTEADALVDYSGMHYQAINKRLYDNITDLKKVLKDTQNLNSIQDIDNQIKILDKAITKSPGLIEDEILWRGGSSKGFDLTPGAINKWKAYTSTSMDKSVAEEFYDDAVDRYGKAVLFKIKAKSGQKATYISEYLGQAGAEAEILLPRNQSWKVLKFDKKTNVCEIELINSKKTNTIKEYNEKLFELPSKDTLRVMGKNLNKAQRRETSQLMSKIKNYKKTWNETSDIKTKDKIYSDITKIQKQLSEFEKIAKNTKIKEASNYNFDTFMKETSQGELEKSQIQIQSKKQYDKKEITSVNAYLSSYHKNINGYLYKNSKIGNNSLPYPQNYIEKYNWYVENAKKQGAKNEKEFFNLIKDSIKSIDTAIKNSPGLSQDTVLYAAKEWNINLNPGDVGECNVFMSTSFRKSGAEGFKDSNRYLIEIYAKEGQKGLAVGNGSGFSGVIQEHEFLLPREQQFKVISVDHNTQTVKIMLL